MNKILIPFIFIVALWVFPLHAVPKRLTIGVEDLNFYPLYKVDKKDLSYHGFAKDLFERFALHIGYRFDYQALPVKRLLRSYIQKKVDFKFPDSPLWKKRQKQGLKITYSAPIINIQGVVMTLPEKVGDKMSPYLMGSILGFSPWQFTEQIKRGKIKIYNLPTAETLIKLAVKGRIDGAYTELSVARYHLNKTGQADALVPDESILKITPETFHISSFQYPKLIEAFNRFLKANKGAVRALKKKYSIL